MNQEISIVINGKPIRQFAFENRLFIEARENTEYSIKVKNNSWNRVLAIVTIDGMNAISGELENGSGEGYIIQGLSSVEIKGFRVSDDKVNQFKFSKKSKSYAALSEVTGGDTQTCGVIGVKIIEEKTCSQKLCDAFKNVEKPLTPWNPPIKPVWLNEPTYSFGGILRGSENVAYLSQMQKVDTTPTYSVGTASIEPRGFDMGTEFSDKEIIDKVSRVEFERGNEAGTIEIFYASRQSLEEMGIVLDKTPAISFPKAFQPAGYCKPPRK